MSSEHRRPARPCSIAIAIALALGCTPGGHGSICGDDSTCGPDVRCLPTETPGRSLCMAPCTDTTRLCDDGAACLDRSGARVCYLGGNRAFGEPCEADTQCEAGTVCPATIGACVQACTVGDDRPCYTGEVCEGPTALEGVCRPGPPDAGTDAAP